MATFVWGAETPVGATVDLEAETISVNVTTGGDDVVPGTAAMYVNGVRITPVEIANASNDYDISHTLSKGDLWHGESFLVQVQIQADDDDIGRHAWTFVVEPGVSVRAPGYKESVLTQALANAFPEWSRIRRSAASVGQMIMNPFAVALDDARDEIMRQHRNHFLQMADRNDLHVLHRRALGEDFEFIVRYHHDGTSDHVAPTILGVDGLAKIPVLPVDDLHDFWNIALPDRIIGDAGTHLVDGGVLVSPTSIVHGSISVEADMQLPGHAYLQAVGTGSFVRIEDGLISFVEAEIHGTTRDGNEDQREIVVFERPGTKRTRREWARIESLVLRGADINPDVEISVHCLMPRRAERFDSQNQAVTVHRETLPSYWSLEDAGHNDVLLQRSFSGSTGLDVFRGDALTEHREFELRNVAGNPIRVEDFCLDRNRRFLWAVGRTHAYVFDLRQDYHENLARLRDRTEDPQTEIFFRPQTLSRRDGILVLGLRQQLRATKSSVLRWRWSVWLPNGTQNWIGHDGTLAGTPTPFVDNDDKNSFHVQEERLDVSLSMPGSHVFVLETIHSDGTTETSMDVFRVDNLRAQREYDLDIVFSRDPVAPPQPSDGEVGALMDAVVRNDLAPMRIHWDSDDRLRIIRGQDMRLLTLRHDLCLVDFEDKEVLFRENYDTVEIGYA